MLVSILIRNYNYARYLSKAIDSALAQTYPDVEVIVVDDGSTDESPAIIDSYGDRVTSLITENRGEAPALNAAFGLSHGDLICILDADDVAEPERVKQVVAAARRVPEAYLIHHQMRVIDADGNPVHGPFPRYVPDGDIRAVAQRAGGWFPHGVASALAFRRSYVERLFPIPSDYAVNLGAGNRTTRVCADTYLAGPAALLAPVAGVAAPLTQYRVHGKNTVLGTSAMASIALFEAETRALTGVMRDTFGMAVELELDGHVHYQLRRYQARQITRREAARRIIRSPSIPISGRIEEIARMVANRGTFART